MVLDGIIGAARKMLSNFSPAVAEGLMRQVQQPFFVVGPLLLLDRRVQMVVPPLSALLADASYIITITYREDAPL